jgi:hypothetical protein
MAIAPDFLPSGEALPEDRRETAELDVECQDSTPIRAR